MNRNEANQLVSETARLYDQIADHFDLTRVHLWPEFDYFTPFLRSGQSVLDLGCGNGRLVQFFENRGISYIGVDISAQLIERAKRSHAGKPWVKFQVGNALDLSTLAGSFDAVTAVAVLQHLPILVIDEALEQINTKLKPGGVLMMTNWNMWQKKFLKIRIGQFFDRLLHPGKKIFGIPANHFGINDVIVHYQTGDKAPQYGRYLYAYTPRMLKKILERYGFTVELNHFCSGNKKASWWRAKNVVTVARKR